MAGLTKSMMEARRDLAGEYPLLAQVTSPSTDKDAYVPIHPGAAAVFDGDEKRSSTNTAINFLWIDAAWNDDVDTGGDLEIHDEDIGKPDERPSMRLYALVGKINEVKSEAELATIEQQIDEILKDGLEKCSAGKVEPGEMGAISLASQRLQYLMAQRRLTLNGTSSTLLRA